MITVTSTTNKHLLGSNNTICLDLDRILTNAQKWSVNTANKETDLTKRVKNNAPQSSEYSMLKQLDKDFKMQGILRIEEYVEEA